MMTCKQSRPSGTRHAGPHRCLVGCDRPEVPKSKSGSGTLSCRRVLLTFFFIPPPRFDPVNRFLNRAGTGSGGRFKTNRSCSAFRPNRLSTALSSNRPIRVSSPNQATLRPAHRHRSCKQVLLDKGMMSQHSRVRGSRDEIRNQSTGLRRKGGSIQAIFSQDNAFSPVKAAFKGTRLQDMGQHKRGLTGPLSADSPSISCKWVPQSQIWGSSHPMSRKQGPIIPESGTDDPVIGTI